MKHFKKIVILLFVLAVCSMTAISAFAANSLGITYEMTINTPELNVSSEAQTIVITIEANQTYMADSMTAQLTTPQGVTIKSITNTELGFTAATVNTANGMISWYSSGWNDALANMDIEAKTIAVYTCTIPANAGAGTYEFTFEASSITNNWFTAWEDGATVSATLTIKDAASEPTCDHATTKLVPNADKTHNVVCANTECGEIVNANVTCAGTDDGDHTTDDKCECGNVVTAGTAHSYTTKASNQQASSADCENAAKYYVQCDYCAAVDTTKTVEVGTANGHSFTTKASNQQASSADCENAAKYYVQCDNCEAVDTTKTVEVGTANGHSFTTKNSNQQASPADCENAAKYYVQCDNCEAVDTTKTVAVGTANGHSFQNGLKGTQFFPGNCTTPAAYYAKCDNCDFENQEKIVTGELNSAKHQGHKEYVKIDEESHKSVCYCGATLGESAHNYDETTHKCECGAVDHICADNLIHVPALEATCNSTGNLEHYKCSCGILYNDAAATYVADPALVILPIDPNNHVWGEVTYSWAKVDNNKKATVKAVRTCTVHTDVVEAAAGKVTAKSVGGDCKLGEHNKIVYTATFTVDWATKQTATYVSPGQSHTHLIYTDNGDGTHHIVCECGNYTPRNNPHKYSTKTHKCTCGAIEPTGWVEKDGVWYYVNADYTNVTSFALLPYPKTAINGITYGPNQEDLDYAASNGTEFAFAEKAYFLFDSEGKFVQSTTLLKTASTTTYIENGMAVWHPGYIKIDSEFYYFVGDKTWGNIAANGIVYATRGLEGKYLFKDGKIVDFTGVDNGLYFVNGKVAMGAGLVKLADGNIIYVRSAGQIATGSYWVTADKANDLVNGGRAYEFDENGYLVTEIAKTGIFDGKYYVEGKLTYAGLIEIDGDIYYINSKGEVVTGKYYVTKTNGMDLGTNKLYFGEDGKMLKIMNGIYEEEGKLYYYVGNRKQCGLGLVEIDGDLYYVRSSGELVTGYFFVTKTNEIEGFKTGDKCKFDENGKLIFNAGQK